MSLLTELERENSKFRVGDGSRSARPKYHLYEIKKAISSARERLIKKLCNKYQCKGECWKCRALNEELGDGK